MMRALWTAATGLDAQMRNLDVTANNLANVNTTGFKRERTEFADLFYAQLRQPGTPGPISGQFLPSGIQVGHGVKLAATTLLFQPGSLQSTSRGLDLAITDQSSLFQIDTGTGTPLYTRDGAFQIDSAGNVVTSAGNKLLPNMTVPANAIDVQVSVTGQVMAVFADQAEQQIGQLELARFPNPGGLRAIGGNLLQQTDASGTPTTGVPGTAPFGEVHGGFLEMSNVSAANELINLITAQRAFDMNSKSITTADDMLQTANNLKR